MRIGLYQFASSNRISDNMNHICRAVNGAAAQSVRLLVFHECALCGYPPLETAVNDIHVEEVEEALWQIGNLARQNRMFIAVGTVRFEGEKRLNAMAVIGEDGKPAGFYDKKMCIRDRPLLVRRAWTGTAGSTQCPAMVVQGTSRTRSSGGGAVPLSLIHI